MSKTVTITTAIKLSEGQRSQLKKGLTSKLGEVTIEEKVDASIIGGVRLMIGSTEYDGSIKAKLEQLRQELHRSLS